MIYLICYIMAGMVFTIWYFHWSIDLLSQASEMRQVTQREISDMNLPIISILIMIVLWPFALVYLWIGCRQPGL